MNHKKEKKSQKKRKKSKSFKPSTLKICIKRKGKKEIEQEKECLYWKCGHNMLIENSTDLNLVKKIESKDRFASSINKKRIRTEMQGK